VLPEIEALAQGALTQITIDAPSAAAMVLAAVPRVAALQAEINALGPAAVPISAEKLTQYAYALLHAHNQHQIVSSPSAELNALVLEGKHRRTVLHADAVALIKRGRLDAKTLQNFHGRSGHRKLVVDLGILTGALRAVWPSIAEHTGVRVEELDEVDALNVRLFEAIAARRGAQKQVSYSSMLRTRVFTLMARSYNEVRTRVAFLRRGQGDAELIAPSLYSWRTAPPSRRGEKRAA
jgi:hypothetical protein